MSVVGNYWARAQCKYYRTGAHLLFRRPLAIESKVPIISFTFDDFPRSALTTGGAILNHFGLAGTYYASLGLTGKQSPSGPIFTGEDLMDLLKRGHELGCHTFDHCHSSETSSAIFENSIAENRRALNLMLPEASFRTFAYPISAPRVWTKQRTGKYFACCRGGGQRFNSGVADLNYLSAYFLEKCSGNPVPVKDMIDANRHSKGWLIFATHDVASSPSPYGCTPEFFEETVCYALSSGARILPVIQAWKVLVGERTS